MRKTLKIALFFILLFLAFSLCNNVQANTINKISMDISINSSGDAYVTEVWDCYTNEGTETYHPYYDIGNSEIKNLVVYDGSISYTLLSKWNTSGTLESKANKCGINKTYDGYEICWGISKYGKHKYTVKYTITNFVSQLSDSQMLYWTLIPSEFSSIIENVYIKIHAPFDFNDNVPVWGYGNYGGTAYVYDGYIEMQSDGRLAKDEYMTILVKFPNGTFQCKNELAHNFNYYYEMAQDGAESYDEGSSINISGIIGFVFEFIYSFGVFIMFFVIAAIKGAKSTKFNYGIEGAKIPKDVPYFREIPCKKDIFRAYYIGYQYKIIKNKTDILGAIILKWLKDSLIRLEQKEGGLIFKKENTVIVLNETRPSNFTDYREQELFRMLYDASKDGVLENKEFEIWCKNSYHKILSWFDSIIKQEREKLVQEGLITVGEKKTFIFKSKQYVATPELRQEALELAGLKRYLNEYTLIAEREAIEVRLFEEYLVYAQMMGIAKKVAQEFKELYPQIIEESCYNSYDNIVFIHMCSSRGVTSANNARTEAVARAQRYSAGGGGFSSRGGGGGSFGGGRGGGGFR